MEETLGLVNHIQFIFHNYNCMTICILAILKGNYLILYNWDNETTLQDNTPSDARLGM